MSKRRGAFAVVLLAATLLPLAARGEGAAAAAARKQATEMYQAYVRGDLDTFVGYMHPKITEMTTENTMPRGAAVSAPWVSSDMCAEAS